MTRRVVDIGTSWVRAGCVGPDGTLERTATAPAPPLVGSDGVREQDLEAIERTVRSLLETLDPGEAGELAMTTQRGTTVLLDASGQPTGPMISWQDRRAGGIEQWMASHEADRWERSVRALSLSSWLAQRWTGRAVEHPATRSPLVRGVPSEAAVGPIALGQDSPVPGGQLWCVGGDKNCELMGAGASEPGRWAISAGTALSLGTLVPSSAPHVLGTYRTPSPVPNLDTVEVGLPVGGSIRERLEPVWGPMPAQLTLPAVHGPVCVPYFGGSLLDSQARERFIGLTGAETTDERWSLVVEGMVLELLYASERLPERVGPIGLCGGMASRPFAQWIADAFATPVLWREGPLSGLFGTAAAQGWMSRPDVQIIRVVPLESRRWSVRLQSYREGLLS